MLSKQDSFLGIMCCTRGRVCVIRSRVFRVADSSKLLGTTVVCARVVWASYYCAIFRLDIARCCEGGIMTTQNARAVGSPGVDALEFHSPGKHQNRVVF